VDNVRQTLRALQTQASACDLASFDVGQVRDLLTDLHRAERALTALKIKAGRRCNALAVEGRGPDADEAFVGSGEVSGATARRDARRAAIVDAIPDLGTAVENGDIGGEHVDAIARAARQLEPELRPLFDAAAADLVNRSTGQPVDTFAKQVRRLADSVTNDHGRAKALAQRAASELSMWVDRDGMGHINAVLDPERYASVTNAISRQVAAMATAAKASGEAVTKGRRLDADAFVELMQQGNGSMGRPDITIVIDHDTAIGQPNDQSVRETVDGAELSLDAINRLCCDAVIRSVTLDSDGVPLDVGRRFRTATSAQWVAIESIYRSCAWNGCDRPVSWCQAHHIHEWNHGGPTNLDNLVPLCSRHHHAVHEGRWTIKLLPDRTLRIFRPDGTRHGNARPDRFDRFDRFEPDQHASSVERRRRCDN